MKRIGLVVLLVALAGLGCLPPSYLRDDHKPPKVEMKEAPAPPVRPEGITEKNAAEVARRLRAELERAAQEPPPEGAQVPQKK